MELIKINKNAKDYGIPIIRDESHKFLEEIIKEKKPTKVLEIGTAVGYSGITILSSCNAKLFTIEHNKDFAKKAIKNFKKYKLNRRVKLILGDCQVEIAKMLASKKYDNYFDIIFLDGPKAQYSNMLDNLLYMLAPNGTFIADNVLFRGYIESPESAPTKRYKTIIKRLNTFIEACKNHKKLTNFKLIYIEDGIITAQKVNDDK